MPLSQELEVASGLAYEWHTGGEYAWETPPIAMISREKEEEDQPTSSTQPGASPGSITHGCNGECFTFNVFALSAVDCQKLEGVRASDGPPRAFASPEETEVPALR